MNRGPEEHRHNDERPAEDAATEASAADQPRESRSPRDAVTPALSHLKGEGPNGPHPARTLSLVSGDFLLTVNPVDGTEIEPCPPGRAPAKPVRRDAADRATRERAGRPAVPPGPAAARIPMLERQDEHDRLIRLLGRGRSIRLSGAPGSGRTAVLEAVAADCADMAPDGVIRLSGHRRTAVELLHELHNAVYDSEFVRPDRPELLDRVRGIGAVVVIDDVEFGGAALDELLGATPECAYLLAVTPKVSAPSAETAIEETFLGGLGRASSLELLERAVERPLTDEETNWAGDLWFESEGLPLRFVQAAALLRQRDQLRRDPQIFDEFEPFAKPSGDPDRATTAGTAFDHAFDSTTDSADGYDIPLPSVAEGAAPADLLASRLSDSARATLRFAVALGGEVPHQAHLPALVGDTHADAALGELMSSGLLSPVGARYRLAPGVALQLTEKGYGDDVEAQAHTAAQHYAWWTGHPSVTPERAAAEADAVLAAMAQLVPEQGQGQPVTTGHPSAAVLLARSAAPAFLAGLHWGAWERALRTGQEAARIAGEVAEEAYFHHELGVLALCQGNLDRARAELEASIAMRGAVADKSGTITGRRALALVTDRENGLTGGSTAARIGLAVDPIPSGPAILAITAALPVLSPSRPSTPTPAPAVTTVIGGTPRLSGPRRLLGGARRNLVAVGTGVLLAAVLGTVVTLGATSGNDTQGSDRVTTEQSTDPDDGSGLPADPPADPSSPAKHSSGKNHGTPGDPGAPLAPSSTGDPTEPSTGTPSESGSPTSPSDSQSSSGGSHDTSPSGDQTTNPTHHTKPPASPPSDPTDPADTPTDPTDHPTEPTDTPTGPTDPEDPSRPDTSASGTSPVMTESMPQPTGTVA